MGALQATALYHLCLLPRGQDVFTWTETTPCPPPHFNKRSLGALMDTIFGSPLNVYFRLIQRSVHGNVDATLA